MKAVLDKRNKDVSDLKSSLNFIKSDDKSTHVVLLVSHKDSFRNDISKICCKSLHSLAGYPFFSKENTPHPVGGYIYNAVNDTYSFSCVDHIILGVVPFYFKVKMENVGLWEVVMPIPEKILNKAFNEDQKQKIDKRKENYPANDFNFHFLQFLVEN